MAYVLQITCGMINARTGFKGESDIAIIAMYLASVDSDAIGETREYVIIAIYGSTMLFRRYARFYRGWISAWVAAGASFISIYPSRCILSASRQ